MADEPRREMPMKQRIAVVLSGLLLAGGIAIAQDDSFKVLLAARSLKCQIGPGSVAKWSDGKVAIEKDTFASATHFDSIDLKSGKARLIGDQGASDVSVWATASGITFVEQTGFGNLVFTTVFSERIPGKADFYAVVSRHMLMLRGNPLPSQYHGSCRIWQ
jgi:hypothetical protein